jgi:hypothetical protein
VLKKIVVWAAILAAIALVTANHLGAFEHIFVSEREIGPIRFVYLPVEGTSFWKVGSVTEEVGHALNVAGATHLEPIGLYYLPGSGKPNEIGFAVDETEWQYLPQLDPRYQQRDIPRTHSMTVQFPFENPLSFVMGFYRVMPLLAAHRAEHEYVDGLSYTILGDDTILYVQPIRRELVSATR